MKDEKKELERQRIKEWKNLLKQLVRAKGREEQMRIRELIEEKILEIYNRE